MKQLLSKINYKKYGILYTILLGILAYSFLVLHFAAVYWDAPPREWESFSLGQMKGLEHTASGSKVEQSGENFLFTLQGTEIGMLKAPISLRKGQYLAVSADISGDPGVTVFIDLFADGYDNPEQEYVTALQGSPVTVKQRFFLGEEHPKEAEFRVYAVVSSGEADGERVFLENVRLQLESNGSVFAPIHMLSLVIGGIFAVLFLLSLWLYLSTREKEVVQIPTAKKGILFGYVKLKMILKLKREEDVICGTLVVVNNGKPIENLSGGSNPVNIAVSIADCEKKMIRQEYKRIPIKKKGVLSTREVVRIPVRYDDLEAFFGKDCYLTYTLVQEGVAWDHSSAVYYQLP